MMKLSDFGFQKINADEKLRQVKNLFERVATRYDLMNDLMSGGLHRLWKDHFVGLMFPAQGAQILDVAGGTGDIAIKLQKKYPYLDLNLTICDLTPSMMEVGRRRSLDQGVTDLRWICGKAEALPLPNESFDFYTISFGLRNVSDLDESLKEAARVLKKGGHFYCLEFSHVETPLLQKLYHAYSFSVLPRLGGIVAKDRAAYQYLVESIRRFPSQEELGKRMKAAGFQNISWQNLAGGIAAIHLGEKM